MVPQTYKIATLSLALTTLQSSAFQCQHSNSAPGHHSNIPPRHFATVNTALRMSSIPDEDRMKRLKLPPLPEDPIALGGDIVALFVYSYLDHTINEAFAAEAENVADLVIADPTTVALEATDSGLLPVWFDMDHLHTFGHNWLADSSPNLLYAPAIADSGLAFVALSTSWLLCGYFSGAFLSANTLDCTSSTALKVTLRTWVGTALLMVVLALGSDALWGWLDGNWNALSAPARGGLTKADADFIGDSLTVLAFWRFMFNWMLGYHKND